MTKQPSTESFISQLEEAMKDTPKSVPNPVAKHAPKFNKPATHKDKKKASKKGEVKHRKDIIPEEEKPIAFTGTTDDALNELARLFALESPPKTEPVIEEQVTEIVPIVVSQEDYDVRAASKELKDLFGVMAGVEVQHEEEHPVVLEGEIKLTSDSLEDAIANILGTFKDSVEDIIIPTEEIIPTLPVSVVDETVEEITPIIVEEVDILPTIKTEEIDEQITSASFISQLEEAAATSKAVKATAFTGSVENAISDLSELFQDTFEIPIPQTSEEKITSQLSNVVEDNAQAAKVIRDVSQLLEKHKAEMPEKEFKIIEDEAVGKAVEYLNTLSEAEYSDPNSMPFTGAPSPLVSSPQFTTAVTGILRKMMATGPGSGVVHVEKLDDIDAATLQDGYVLAYKPNVPPINLPFKWIDAAAIGDITKITAGQGLTGGGTSGDVDIAVMSELGITATEITPSVHVVPATDDAVDLGTDAKRFRKLYLSQNSIDLGGAIISSDGTGTISIAATGAVLPVGSKVGADAIGTANTVTGVSTRNVPFFTRAGGDVTAAATYVFKGSGADDIEFENFFFSNGTNIMDTQTFAQFVF